MSDGAVGIKDMVDVLGLLVSAATLIIAWKVYLEAGRFRKSQAVSRQNINWNSYNDSVSTIEGNSPTSINQMFCGDVFDSKEILKYPGRALLYKRLNIIEMDFFSVKFGELDISSLQSILRDLYFISNSKQMDSKESGVLLIFTILLQERSYDHAFASFVVAIYSVMNVRKFELYHNKSMFVDDRILYKIMLNVTHNKYKYLNMFEKEMRYKGYSISSLNTIQLNDLAQKIAEDIGLI